MIDFFINYMIISLIIAVLFSGYSIYYNMYTRDYTPFQHVAECVFFGILWPISMVCCFIALILFIYEKIIIK